MNKLKGNLGKALEHLSVSLQSGTNTHEDSERRKDVLEWERKMDLQKQYEHAGIFKRFIKSDFNNFNPYNSALEQSLNLSRSYAEAIINGMTANLVMSGLVGNGKTHLAVAIMKVVLHANKKAYYTTLFDALQELKNFRGDVEGFRKKLREPDLLVIDEVNSSLINMSETDKNLVFEIFNTRYKDQKPIVVITNLKADGLEQALGYQVVSRLYEDSQNILSFANNDYRIQKGK